MPIDPSAGQTDPKTDFAARILAVARDSDRTAFGELFEYFGPRLKSYFIRVGLNSGRAEELAQETMLTVWRKAKYFDPDRAGASTWIFVIARNLRIDLLRRDRAEQSALSEPFETEETQQTGETVALASEREARVRAALTKLSEEQAAVIRLSFFSDTPHGDIAAQLGIPLGTVKSRIRLAMARLRELLGDAQ